MKYAEERIPTTYKDSEAQISLHIQLFIVCLQNLMIL